MERKNKILGPDFFARPTTKVARDLVGKFLIRSLSNGQKSALMITETEAYDGFRDKASHASKGATLRNMPMFGPPGYWYVYLVYGMHEMLNISTREKGYPAAVLIRGVTGYDGPGKLTAHLKIGRSLSGKKAGKGSGLWIEDRGIEILPSAIRKTPRIGVAYAGPVWSAKKWRFILKDIKEHTGKKE